MGGKNKQEEDRFYLHSRVKLVKDFIPSLLIASKNYALYPDNHRSCQSAIETVISKLEAFFKIDEKLRLSVFQDYIQYETESVLQDPSADPQLAFFLYRDGIRWIEFLKGIDPKEIAGFIKIFNRYKIPSDEAEGDLVTAMWHLNPQYLKYQVIDILFEDAPLIDLDSFSVKDAHVDNGLNEQPDSDDTDISDEDETPAESYLQPLDSSLWELTSDERQALESMLSEQKDHEQIEDVLEVLTIILTYQETPLDFSTTLNFLKHEFKNTLAFGDFRSAVELIYNLRKFEQENLEDKKWAVSIISEFFQDIAKPQILNSLDDFKPGLNWLEPENLDLLKKLLYLLPPSVIPTIGPMLTKNYNTHIKAMLAEVIYRLASEDIDPVKILLENKNDQMVKQIINIIVKMNTEGANLIIADMLEHPSEDVREAAVKALIQNKFQVHSRVAHMIADPCDSIKTRVLKFLGESKSKLSEDILLRHLKDKEQTKEPNHILACYKALSQCASEFSLPFLKQMLLGQYFSLGKIRSTHRKGAVLVLESMETPEAKSILKNAAITFNPAIRRALKSK